MTFARLPWRAALLYLTAALLAVACSADVNRSAFSILVQATLGLLCLWLAKDKADRLAILRGLAVFSLGIFAINFVPWLVDGAPPLWRVVNEKNSGVAMFNAIFIVALAAGELKRPMWWPWCAAFAWLTWFTGSRGGVLGLSASVVTVAIVGSLSRRAISPAPLLAWWPLAFAPVALLAAAFDAGRLLSLSSRDRYWSLAWEMFAARPVTGFGPDTFKAEYASRFPGEVVFNHAHSLYLNTLAEGGLIVFIAMLILIASSARLLWQRRSSAWAVGALAMLVGVLAHSLVDTPLNSLIVSTTVLALLGAGLRA